MDNVLAVVTVTVVGLMVGVEFAVAFVIGPILLRLPAGPALAGRADGGRMLGRVMPFWYIGSVILAVALAIVNWGSATATVTIVAAILLMLSVVMSVAFLVPINNRSKTWTEESHPDDWREQSQRWDRLHYGRVALIVAAFVLVALAVVLQ
jgi:hypothetical protein